MSWKRGITVVLLVAGLVGAGTAYVRIADLHAPAPDQRLDTDQTPQGIIDQARTQYRTVEYRSVARVYRVDDTGERTPTYIFEDAYDYSDRQYVGNYVTLDPQGDIAAPHYHFLGHYHGEVVDDDPARSLYYVTDGRSASSQGNATEFAIGKYIVDNPWISRAGFRGAYAKATFLNHTANWRVVKENASTLVLGIDDPHEYYRTRPMWEVEEIHDGSSIRVTVDKDAGRIARIVEHRVVTKEVHVTETDENGTEYESYEHRRVHYVIETAFTDYGSVDVKRPDGLGRPTVKQYFYDFLNY